MTIAEYYQQPPVRRRLAEYCGAASGEFADATCHYLLLSRPPHQSSDMRLMELRRSDRLPACEDWISDIFRSIWDRAGSFVAFDVEYVNSDLRGEIFVYPERAFGKVEPLYDALEDLLAELGLRHLTVMTGQGYHFTWYLPAGSPGEEGIVALGRPPDTLLSRYQAGVTVTGETVTPYQGRLHCGVGMVLELLAHAAIQRAALRSQVPIVSLGLEVGNRGPAGRDAVSLDLSAYADPLDRRYVRCAFSTYQKHRSMAATIGPGIAFGTPPRACVLRERGQSLEEALPVQQDLATAAAAAARASAAVPPEAEGMGELLRRYQESRLAAFHRWYYAVEPDPPERWPRGYNRLNLAEVPPCVSLPLSRPNDLLLKPTNLQNVLRVLWARGRHPRHVAGLVRSKYERNFGWGRAWYDYDAATRADTLVRMLASLVGDGTDDLRDFNCISHQEKGFCPQPFCGHSLGDCLKPLLERQP
jgi:hypothetical protein